MRILISSLSKDSSPARAIIEDALIRTLMTPNVSRGRSGMQKPFYCAAAQRDAHTVDDHGVDPDDAPVRISEGSSGVPWLQSDIRAQQDLAGCRLRREDAHRKRTCHAHRISHREHKLSRTQRACIARLRLREASPLNA